MSADGWLKITGRINDQYKLENGKYVCATPIEEAVGMSRFIKQVVLYGANRPYNVALLVPDFGAIRAELEVDCTTTTTTTSGGGVLPTDDELLVTNDKRVNALIQRENEDKCSKLKKFEVPQKFAFVAPFTAANNMLTPKMSIMRHEVLKHYAGKIDSMYDDDDDDTSIDGGVSEERSRRKVVLGTSSTT